MNYASESGNGIIWHIKRFLVLFFVFLLIMFVLYKSTYYFLTNIYFDSKDIHNIANEADILARKGKYDSAILKYKIALFLDTSDGITTKPVALRAYYGLANCYLRKGDIKNGKIFLAKYSKNRIDFCSVASYYHIDTKHNLDRLVLAINCLNQGDIEKSKNLFKLLKKEKDPSIFLSSACKRFLDIIDLLESNEKHR